MKRVIIAFVLSGIMLLSASCVQHRGAPAAPAGTAANYEEAVSRLIHGLAAEVVTDRYEPQRELNDLCLHAAAPGHEEERRALCEVMVGHLGEQTPLAAREWLVRQLDHVGGGECVPALTGLLSDEEPLIREAARRALQNNPSEAAAVSLRAELGKTDEPVWQIACVNALAARRDEASVPRLIELTRSEDDGVSRAAVAALGDIGGKAATGALYEMWWSPDNPRREEAATAVLRIADTLLAAGDEEGAVAIYFQLYGAALRGTTRLAALRGAVAASDGTMLDKLPPMIGLAQAAQVRITAVRLLGRIDGPAVTELLIESIYTTTPEVQAAIIEELAKRPEAEARETVTHMYRTVEAAEARGAALRSLPGVGGAEDVVPVAELAASLSGEEQEAARWCLSRLYGPDVDETFMTNIVSASAAETRAELVRALAARHCRAAVPRLMELHAGWGALERTANYGTLAKLAADEQLPQLVAFLVKETDEDVQRAGEDAVVAVCQRSADREQRAQPVLAALPETTGAARASLVRVLGRLQGAAALAAIREAVHDSDEDVAIAAVRALAGWEDTSVLEDLLTLAREGERETHRVLALRGYVRLLRLPSDRAAADTLARLHVAAELAQADNEKKLVLSALGEVILPETLEEIRPYLGDKTLCHEAAAAAVHVARGLAGQDRELAMKTMEEVLSSPGADTVRERVTDAMKLIDQYEGYIGVWRFAGPFTSQKQSYEEMFDLAFPPEEAGEARLLWQALPAGPTENPWAFDLTQLTWCENCCLYVRARVYSPQAQAARLEIGSDDGVRAWLNGALVHSNEAARAHTIGQDKVPVALEQGWNTVMLKVVQGNGGWGFSCGVRGPDGEPLTGLRFSTEP
ncbi:MAG: HEAT repeat domain-containing protein [Phycisphaerae bacterium]|jgi:HEAT repeat protein